MKPPSPTADDPLLDDLAVASPWLVPRIARLRRQGAGRLRSREVALIYEAVNRDLGAGD